MGEFHFTLGMDALDREISGDSFMVSVFVCLARVLAAHEIRSPVAYSNGSPSGWRLFFARLDVNGLQAWSPKWPMEANGAQMT